jgi:dienelactone hydrolase
VVSIENEGFPTARADYRAGRAGLPAVLILHGFLQTHEFGTVHRMVEGLSSEGYTVLAPTLTLGVPYRRSSLPCEAIHKHRFTDAYAELDAWLAWLRQRHRGPVVLVGHSFGSAILIGYLQQRKPAQVRKFIAVSLTEARTHKPEKEVEALRRELRQRLAKGERKLVTLPLSYCQRYTAPPDALLSYLDWDTNRILSGVRRLKLDHAMIMGGGDDLISPDWIDRLRRAGRVHVVEGANHFLDGLHEFELLDILLQELKSVQP